MRSYFKICDVEGKRPKNSETNHCTVDLQIPVAVQRRMKTYKITFSKNRGNRKNWSGPDPTDPTGSAGPVFPMEQNRKWPSSESILYIFQ